LQQVTQDTFVNAAKVMKRQITPAIAKKYERWSSEHGVTFSEK